MKVPSVYKYRLYAWILYTKQMYKKVFYLDEQAQS